MLLDSAELQIQCNPVKISANFTEMRMEKEDLLYSKKFFSEKEVPSLRIDFMIYVDLQYSTVLLDFMIYVGLTVFKNTVWYWQKESPEIYTHIDDHPILNKDTNII